MIKRKILEFIAGGLLAAGLVLVLCYISQSGLPGNTDREARKVGRVVRSRLSVLDNYSRKVLSQSDSLWPEIGNVPQDMVLYRYIGDTLQFWCNEFSVFNDNINSRPYVPFIVNPRISVESPLLQVTDSVRFVSMGPKLYLAKYTRDGDRLVISGLELVNYEGRGGGGMRSRGTRGAFRGGRGDFSGDDFGSVNSNLHLDDGFSIRPLATPGGSAVTVDGRPMFKIVYESLKSTYQANANIIWIAVLFFIASLMLFLLSKKSVSRFIICSVSLVAVSSLLYFWGRSLQNAYDLFSPTIYAGNGFLYSLGAVIIVNAVILLLSLCVYFCRNELFGNIRTRSAQAGIAAVIILAIAGVIFYSLTVLRSIVLNSGISLEIYKLPDLSSFCVTVYVSFISMLMSVPLLLQSLQPLSENLLHRKFDAFSIPGCVAYSVIIALYLVTTSAVLGFQKEQDRMEVLSNRLAFDRDISLEQRLSFIEPQIANDMIISALSILDNTASSIQNRIVENYFSRNDQNYTVTVNVFNTSNNSQADAALYNSILRGGVPIADNSRFLFVKNGGGHSYYVGVFFYLSKESVVSRVLVRLESKDTQDNKGYAGIFGITPPGKVNVPSGYSYARYQGADLETCKGNYDYPTKMNDRMYSQVYNDHPRHIKYEGYTHFCTAVGDGEAIIISRATIGVLTYIVAGIFIALISFLVMSIFSIKKKKDALFMHGYFRSRIAGVLSISLILTMIAMAFVSVYFVFSRNDANMHAAMSEKIGTITTMIEAGTRDTQSTADINFQQLRELLDRVSTDTNSDITLYTPSGRLLMSTTPMVFDRQFLGGRLNGAAYGNIVYGNRRYCIQKERVGPKKIFSMYAPIMGGNGSNMIAIACSPYYEENYDFEKDALTHSMTIISLFLVFLIASLLMATKTVDRMFKPLGEMSSKMQSAGIDSLEYIQYDRDDEISSIVQSYNRMVTDLSESSKVLAQAERDKAWSGMARQVAHEIKNPLTPMKLELQRIIRLRDAGNPIWQERFDSASKIILDQIDILTDTANQFSDFAKLYTEEPSEINLDELLHEQIMLYDNRDNITFDFIGFSGAIVNGPKPQLTRVFVNLLNNSVQAIADAPGGRVMVSLRNSSKDGYYDIVFEDNGPGVSEDNIPRLFTPNFTTKSSGSGLGLAISHSILEKCGARISYGKSFSLGGACFTICYPK